MERDSSTAWQLAAVLTLYIPCSTVFSACFPWFLHVQCPAGHHCPSPSYSRARNWAQKETGVFPCANCRHASVSSYAEITAFVSSYNHDFFPCFLTFHVFLLVSSLKELERRQSREKKQDTADFSCIDKLKDDEPPKCCTCPTTVVLLCPPIRLQEEERRAPVFMCRHVKTSEASMFLFLVGFLFKCTCWFIPRTGQS